ncbi:HAD family hydrolase [Kushneria marisflavi]|uniref:Haloacid dehalogenase n=1 Tax=Kushneria marisflavi TaxID=157779 RepID=A0A240US33_9GAMM|nr:HAD-IA family hydrolase [Kushneria marisflavi]ART63830.1 haloacid dehalogenase [Kushneria marisflavi]RKD85534.1 HAD superfamily hydrolase (TIGR01509 family) [Kushneria marisflavi]
MARLKCLIFDCDGTLVDSEPLLAEVLSQTLPEAGLPFRASDYMNEFRGVVYAHIVAELEQRHGAVDETVKKEAEARMRSRLMAGLKDSLIVIEGIEASLDILQPEYLCCVASNGPLNKIRQSMEVSKLGRFFGDHLFSAYDVGHFKPDPELFLHAARVMGVAPEECLVIDDAPVGITAALAAGMQVAHINHFPEEEQTPERAHELLHMKDLPALVHALNQT